MVRLGRSGELRRCLARAAVVWVAFGLGGCLDDNKPEHVAVRRVEVSPNFLIYKHTSPKEVKLAVLESTPTGVIIRAANNDHPNDRNSLKFRVKPDGAVELWNWRYEEFFMDLPADENR